MVDLTVVRVCRGGACRWLCRGGFWRDGTSPRREVCIAWLCMPRRVTSCGLMVLRSRCAGLGAHPYFFLRYYGMYTIFFCLLFSALQVIMTSVTKQNRCVRIGGSRLGEWAGGGGVSEKQTECRQQEARRKVNRGSPAGDRSASRFRCAVAPLFVCTYARTVRTRFGQF